MKLNIFGTDGTIQYWVESEPTSGSWDMGESGDKTGYFYAQIYPDGRIKATMFPQIFTTSELKHVSSEYRRISSKYRHKKRYIRMMARRGLLAEKRNDPVCSCDLRSKKISNRHKVHCPLYYPAYRELGYPTVPENLKHML
jgi:hypothetical protein